MVFAGKSYDTIKYNDKFYIEATIKDIITSIAVVMCEFRSSLNDKMFQFSCQASRSALAHNCEDPTVPNNDVFSLYFKFMIFHIFPSISNQSKTEKAAVEKKQEKPLGVQGISFLT